MGEKWKKPRTQIWGRRTNPVTTLTRDEVMDEIAVGREFITLPQVDGSVVHVRVTSIDLVADYPNLAEEV